MRDYLLDTHVLLWAVSEPAALSAAAREAITDLSATLWVSPVSWWELSTKTQIGKLSGGEAILARLDDDCERLGVRDLPVGRRHATLAGSLAWAHRDPFDRILVAQALIEGLTLVTRDAVVRDHPQLASLW